MKKIYTLTIFSLLLFSSLKSFGQFSFTNGTSSFEISGYIIAYYQFRQPIPPAGTSPDLHKSTFQMDDARLNLKGYYHGKFKYELEMNYVDVVNLAINGLKDIKSAPLTEANIVYINPVVNIKAGYFKLPFSPSSIMDKVPSPFLQRSLIADGDYFTRRDAGVLLMKDFWHQRINITAGVVSGVGEQILLGAGDKSGWPEFVARLQFSSAHYRDEELDWRNLSTPLFRVGVDARYNKKTSYYGQTSPYTSYDGAWQNIEYINGQKISYGADAAIMWHGFSAQFEFDQAYNKPNQYQYGTQSLDVLYNQLSQYNTNYFKNGGFLVQANYCNRKLWSVFAVRYSEYDITDLASLNYQERTMTFAYNFVVKNSGLTIKLHYDYRIKCPTTNLKWDNDQFRGGFQWVF